MNLTMALAKARSRLLKCVRHSWALNVRLGSRKVVFSDGFPELNVGPPDGLCGSVLSNENAPMGFDSVMSKRAAIHRHPLMLF